MSRGVNRVILIGHLGGNPELRSTPSGIQVATFSIATSERWKDKQTGEAKERTEWHRCEVWGKTAEIAGQYMSKGRQVYCEGSLRTEKWTDKEGIERYTTKIRVDQFLLLGSAGDHSERPAKEERAERPVGKPVQQTAFDDDIPF